MILYCPYVTCKNNSSNKVGEIGECTCTSIMLVTVEVEERNTQYLDCPRYVNDENRKYIVLEDK